MVVMRTCFESGTPRVCSRVKCRCDRQTFSLSSCYVLRAWLSMVCHGAAGDGVPVFVEFMALSVAPGWLLPSLPSNHPIKTSSFVSVFQVTTLLTHRPSPQF